MKKMLALLTIATLLVGCSGCQTEIADTPSIIETESPGTTLEVSLSHSYSGKPIDTGDISSFQNCVSFGNRILAQGYMNGAFCLVLFDPDTEEILKTPMEDGYSIAGIDIEGDTIDAMLVHHNEDYTEFRLELATFDSSLNELQREDVTEAWGHPSEPGSWARDAQGNSYLRSFSVGILLLTADGTLHTINDSDGTEMQFRGRDGRVYSIPEYMDNSVSVYNPDTLTKEKIIIDFPNHGYNEMVFLPGNEEFDFLAYNSEYLYGVTIGDGSVTELMNWDESDFNADSSGYSVFLLPDGRVMLCDESYWLLSPRTQEEMDSMKLISLATTSYNDTSNYLTKMVQQYNRQANGHHITIKHYNDGQSDNLESLEKDLLNGIVPDILSANISNYQMLSNKGMFEDLSIWMENDSDFHEEDYLMNFFDSMRYKGRLERMAFQFGISAWMTKTEYAGLSAPEYVGMPEGMTLLGGGDKNTALEKIVYYELGNFVDHENGTCHFDSIEFVQLLEHLQSLPDFSEVVDAYAFAEDRALLYQANINSLKMYHEIVQSKFGNADVTLTGAPFSTEGNGGVFFTSNEIMMSSASAYKEEIWAFIKFCLSKENQMPKYNGNDFPVRIDALTAALELAQQPDESAIGITMPDGVFIAYTPATAEEADELLTYIRGITLNAEFDVTVKNIVSEEAGKYIAGDCSAEEAANVIQGRVSLYLAEQS